MYLRYHAGRSMRHVGGAIAEGALIVGIAGALVFGVAVVGGGEPAGADDAYAGKSSSASWIELAQVDGRLAASAQPSLGDYVAFDAGYPRTVKNPRILVNCYQDGSLVFGMGGSVAYEFLLGGGGSIWKDKGGAADCTATLFYYGYHAGQQVFNELARTSFSAGG